MALIGSCLEGYYSRTAALRHLLDKFLRSPDIKGPRQVISLGAGFDTTFFQLQANGTAPDLYVELDLPEVTARKAAIIAAEPGLRQSIPVHEDAVLDAENGRVITQSYCLLPVDLRQPAALQAVLEQAKLQPNLPTYIIAECVLVYMRPEESNAAVRWLGSYFQQAAFVIYEQIKPHDAFGQEMLKNLQCLFLCKFKQDADYANHLERGCPLHGIHGTPDLAAHEHRFLQNGWTTACARDMNAVYNKHIDPSDRRRIERLELLDEFEEWTLIQGHYCIVIATKDGTQRMQQIVDLPSYQPISTPYRPILAG